MYTSKITKIIYLYNEVFCQIFNFHIYSIEIKYFQKLINIILTKDSKRNYYITTYIFIFGLRYKI